MFAPTLCPGTKCFPGYFSQSLISSLALTAPGYPLTPFLTLTGIVNAGKKSSRFIVMLQLYMAGCSQNSLLPSVFETLVPGEASAQGVTGRTCSAMPLTEPGTRLSTNGLHPQQ